jgi:hypothetical protein
MDEKTLSRVYEADVMALPPLRLVLGDVPSPDPDRRRSPASRTNVRETPEPTLLVVRRLITHLEQKQ